MSGLKEGIKVICLQDTFQNPFFKGQILSGFVQQAWLECNLLWTSCALTMVMVMCLPQYCHIKPSALSVNSLTQWPRPRLSHVTKKDIFASSW